jgi:hypothetical protein
MIQFRLTFVFSPDDSTKCEYDTVCIFSFVEEDGENKILEIKDFCDPQKRNAFYVEAEKAAAKGVAAS